jgi:molecular chaperone GrpE
MKMTNNELMDEVTQENTGENQPGQAENNKETLPEENKEIIDSKDELKEKGHKPKAKKDQKIQKVEEELEKVNDKYLRLYSEYDNYRKRTIKEKIELSKTAAADVITTFLPVLDDFERAINAFKTASGDPDPLKDGVVLIYTKFLSLLNQQGLEQMKTIGSEFNTDFHDAITHIPAANSGQKGKVIDEVEKGYTLNGKVIRYAKVVVGS